MFLKNCWYHAGWDFEVTLGKESIVPRKIAGETILLYRKPDGAIVAMEDRCPHRQAALSLGRKEGESLRCMYHGLKFAPDGKCVEVPGQTRIPEAACVRVYPVVETNNCIWVWMGDREKADPALICPAVPARDSEWAMHPGKMHVRANYRLEVANLADLSHLAWVHEKTLGGSSLYAGLSPDFIVTPRGLNTKFWVRSAPVQAAVAHLFPEGSRVDVLFDIQHTVPCNWIMHHKVFVAGADAQEGSSEHLIFETFTCQYVTPCDADSVDYYYCWGPRREQDIPGLSEMLRDVAEAAFIEDAAVLEAQHIRMKEKPDFRQINFALDAGPGRMLWVLDKLLKEEAEARAAEAG